LRYAGVDPRRVIAFRTYDREDVIREVRNLCVRGYSVDAAHVRRRNRRLNLAAIEHFGNWKNALEATGIAPTRAKSRQRDKQKIIEAIQQRHKMGLSMKWCDACLDDRSSAQAAKHAFRSWRRALVAAGVIPEIPTTRSGFRWDKKRVISAIQELTRRKKPPTNKELAEEYSAIISAARRHFGTWKTALKHAGVVLKDSDGQNEEN